MAVLLPLVSTLAWQGAAARTLAVGPGLDFARPSQAAAVAVAGDRITLAAGTYYDCAVLAADDLVIEGSGADTRLTDATCQGKAVLVVTGRGVTVRNLTLARARVADGNGAGLRAEGADLTLQGVRIEDNQDGLLAADAPGGTLRVDGCRFTANGVAGGVQPTADLVVGHWARLDIRDTRFAAARGQAVIRSAAALTSVEASRLDGAPGGASIEVGGGLVLENSGLAAGGGPGGRRVAVLALPAAEAAPLTLRGNTLAGGGVLLLNWSGRDARLAGNLLPDGGTLASSSGAWLHRLRAAAAGAWHATRAVLGAVHRHLVALLP